MRKIRVFWKYQDEPNKHEDFEVDDDVTSEEIEEKAEEIAFEHFRWSFWDITNKK